MARWEVRTRGGSVEVEGANWLLALGVALPALGLEADVLARLVCDVQPGGVVRIVDPVSRTPFLVRRMPDEARPGGARAVMPVGIMATGPSGDAAPADAEPVTQGYGADGRTEDRTGDFVADDTDAPPPSLRMPQPVAATFNPELLDDDATSTIDPDAIEPITEGASPPPPPPHLSALTTMHPSQVDAPDAGRLKPGNSRWSVPVPETPAADFTDEHLATLDDLEPVTDDESVEAPTEPPADLAEQLFMDGMDVADAESIEKAAETTLRILQKFVPAESASVLYAGLNDTELRFLAAQGPTADKVLELTVPLGTGIAGFCFDSGAALIIRNAESDPRHLHHVDEETGYRTQDLLTVPLRDSAGRIHGCIQLLNAPAGFATWHLEVSSTLGSTLADFILSQGGAP